MSAFGDFSLARQLVRERVGLGQVCQIAIARGQLGVLDPATGLVSGLTDANTIFTGQARIYQLPTGQPVDLGGGQFVERDTTISIPFDAPMVYRDDLVTVIDGGPDANLASRIFRVLGASGGGLFMDARRLSAASWLQSYYWGES